ncbi:unnamed protein product [Tetraodon nigroviridis]|uniref:(spotted green pufferfish) hypothetical protein n=1 Tax=Tetraodon nigroviridis TaxID=99883 RepID=Q4SI70_TETNG|nr:unnamed protein product [Tetraodon nigroviridis]
MSSKQATSPFASVVDGDDAMSQDNLSWDKEESAEAHSTPQLPLHSLLHGKAQHDEMQQLSSIPPESEWDSMVSAQQRMESDSNKVCSQYSFRNNSTSPHKPEEGARERSDMLSGSAFGTPERRKGSLADVVDTLKQKNAGGDDKDRTRRVTKNCMAARLSVSVVRCCAKANYFTIKFILLTRCQEHYLFSMSPTLFPEVHHSLLYCSQPGPLLLVTC